MGHPVEPNRCFQCGASRARSQPCCPCPYCLETPFAIGVFARPLSAVLLDIYLWLRLPQDSDPATTRRSTCSTLSSDLVTTLLSTQVPRAGYLHAHEISSHLLLPPLHLAALLLIFPPHRPSVSLLPLGRGCTTWPSLPLSSSLTCAPNPSHQHSGRQSKPSELDHGTLCLKPISCGL